MIAEQTTSYRYWIAEQRPPVTIELTARVEIPGEDEADVTTVLQFEEPLAPRIEEAVRQGLYDGVHGGIAAAGFPLPAQGLTVRVLRLRLDPPDSFTGVGDIRSLGRTVQSVMTEVVASLWSGLRNLALPEKVRQSISTKGDQHLAGLSTRETEVLRLAALGMTSAEVGEELGLAPSTVRSSLSSIYRRLGLSSLYEAREFARSHGLG